jgi:hypothetical protein
MSGMWAWNQFYEEGIFIYGLFNSAVTGSNCVMLNEKMISE